MSRHDDVVKDKIISLEVLQIDNKDTSLIDSAAVAPLKAFKMVPNMISCAGWLHPEITAIMKAVPM